MALRDAQCLDEAIKVHQTAAAVLLKIGEKDQAGQALNNLAIDLGLRGCKGREVPSAGARANCYAERSVRTGTVRVHRPDADLR
jgi:hypothetical protein